MNFTNKNLKIALVLTSISLVVCIIIIINSGMLNTKEGMNCLEPTEDAVKDLINQINKTKDSNAKADLEMQLANMCNPEPGCPDIPEPIQLLCSNR